MKIAPPPRFVSRLLAAAVATLIAGEAGAQNSGAPNGGVYYERAFVLAADQKCGLFEPGLTAALDAATLQARGAALRAGGSGPELSATARRAQARAEATACDDAE